MQKRDALTLLDEYLTSSEIRLRQNAITALAAISTEASIAKLVRVALADGNADIRERAEAELAQLTGEQAEIVERVLRSELDRQRPGRVDVWYLINQLRLRGWSHSGIDVAPLKRLMIALAMRRMPALQRTRKVGPLVALGLGGTVVGVLAVSLYLLSSGTIAPTRAFWITLAGAALATGAFLSVVSTRLSAPTGAYHDRRMASLTEIGTVWVLTAGVTLLVVVALLILGVLGEGSQIAGVFVIPLSAACVVAAVRGGTMIASGAWTTASASATAQILAGGAAGLLASTAILAIARSTLGQSADGGVSGLAISFEALWLLIVPTVVGLALAFALIERAIPAGVIKPHLRRVLTVALVAIAVTVVGRAASQNVMAFGGMETVSAEPLQSRQATVAITRLPFVYRFAAGFPQKISATIDAGENESTGRGTSRVTDVSLNLVGFRPTGRDEDGAPLCSTSSTTSEQIADASTRNRLEETVTWGCFGFEIRSEEEEEPTTRLSDSIFNVLSTRAARAAGKEEQPRATHSLRLQLNVDMDQPFNGTVDVNTVTLSLVSGQEDVEFDLPDSRIVRIAIRPPSHRLATSSATPTSQQDPSSSATVELLQLQGTNTKRPINHLNDKEIEPGASIEGLVDPGRYRIHADLPDSAAGLAHTLRVETATKLTATGAWTITQIPSTRVFSLDAAREVTIDADSVTSSGSIDTELELFSVGSNGSSLMTADDPEVITMTLQRGEYRVELRPLSNRNAGASVEGTMSLDLLPPARSLPLFGVFRAQRGETVAGDAPATRVPFERTFAVDFEQEVRISVERDEDEPDLVLELWNGSTRVDRADDPELIRKRLPPGTYTVKVGLYDAEEPPQALSNTRLRIALNVRSER